MIEIQKYLETRREPKSKEERRKLRNQVARYTFVEGKLYKRSFTLPFLKCLNEREAEYALRQVHEGVRGNHLGARIIAHMFARGAYYWQTIKKDVVMLV